MIGAVLWRLWICFVRGADPSADLCHGIIVQLGTLGHFLQHSREVLALALGPLGAFVGHFELFGKRLYLLQQRRKLPVLAFRGALSRFGIAKLATMLKKGVPDSSYVPIGNKKLLKRIEVDRKAETAWRARKRTINSLPKRISETVTKGREVLKEAKGLS